MEIIKYLMAIDIDEKDIVNTIFINYFNVDQRREFNQHLYKIFVTGVTDADDDIELPESEFESPSFKELYLDGFITDLDILAELEQYLSSDDKDDLEEWLIKAFDITSCDIDYIDD